VGMENVRHINIEVKEVTEPFPPKEHIRIFIQETSH
jgi:hypothetical protein